MYVYAYALNKCLLTRLVQARRRQTCVQIHTNMDVDLSATFVCVSHSLLFTYSTRTGKEEADMRSEMRTNMDVDAGEEERDDGLRVQVSWCVY